MKTLFATIPLSLCLSLGTVVFSASLVGCRLDDNRLRGSIKINPDGDGQVLFRLEGLSEALPLLDTGTLQISIENKTRGAIEELAWTEIHSPFELIGTDCGDKIEPEESCGLEVVFHSPGEGIFSSPVTFSYRDFRGAVRTQDIELTGSGQFPGVGQVVKLYPEHGANWNDYVRRPDLSLTAFELEDEPCDPAAAELHSQCVHGAELLMVNTGLHSCEGLELTESLDVFDWFCLEREGQARFFSRGLLERRGLKDLIEASGWRSNSIEIRREGQLILTTPTSVWWENPVVPLPDNSATELVELDNVSGEEPGTIYYLSESRATKGYDVVGDKVAVVVADGAVLSGASTIEANRCHLFPSNYRCLVYFRDVNFNWFEGQLSGLGSDATALLSVRDSKRLVVQNTSLLGSSQRGLTLYYVGSSVFRHLSIANTSWGIDGSQLMGSILYSVDIQNSQVHGVSIDPWAFKNTFQSVRVTSSRFYAFNIAAFRDTNLIGISALNSGSMGFYLDSVFSYRNTFLSLLSANNSTGMQVHRLTQSVFTNVATLNTRYGIDWFASSDQEDNANRFSGALLIGGQTESPPCNILDYGRANVGLVHGNCTDTGADGSSEYTGNASTAVLRTERSIAGAFRGKVSETDSVNPADALGLALYGNLVDFFSWFRFENRFRAWGKHHPDAFPSTNNRRDCEAGETCQIWDWRLDSAGTAIYNRSGDGANPNSPFVAGEPCPPEVHGDRVETNLNESPSTYLIHAMEIPFDGVGNDNGLCESGERCIYMPHFGAYQGQGNYRLNECQFQDGVVSGVTMYAYPDP